MSMQSERSLPELLGALTQDIITLVRQEMHLAKAELLLKATYLGKNAGLLGVGVLIGYAGLLVTLVALVLLLAKLVPLWISALLIGTMLALISVFIVSKSLSALRSENLVPQQMLQSLQEIKNG